MPDPMTLTDLRERSKGASAFASLVDAVGSIRSAGRLPSSVSDTAVLGYANMVTAIDPAAMGAWEGRVDDPKGWRDEVSRLGYELASMVVDIKNGRRDSGRPSEEALAAAAGNDRMWRDHTDSVINKKPAPAKKPPTEYTSIDDIADGLTALGRIPPYVPRPFVVGVAYGLLNSDPALHQAWIDYDTDPQALKDLLPAAARALGREISNIQAGAAVASPQRPFTPAQEARMSDKEWNNFQQDFNGVDR
jgi:hypothetical protein